MLAFSIAPSEKKNNHMGQRSMLPLSKKPTVLFHSQRRKLGFEYYRISMKLGSLSPQTTHSVVRREWGRRNSASRSCNAGLAHLTAGTWKKRKHFQNPEEKLNHRNLGSVYSTVITSQEHTATGLW